MISPSDQRANPSYTQCIDAASLTGLWAVALSLGFTWLGLLFGLRPGSAELVLAFIVAAALMVKAAPSSRPLFTASVGLAAAVGAGIVCVFIAGMTFDNSWDGMAYHQLAIAMIREGWNPLSEPHAQQWLSTQTRWPTELTATIADNEIWIEHYPKGSWLLGAAVASATGKIGTAKWLQFYVLLVSIGLAWRGFLAIGIQRWPAIWASITAGLGPVVVAQLGTNYVDGLLGSTVLAASGLWLSWYSQRRAVDLFSLIAALTFMASLKFTGAAYAALLVIMVGAVSATGIAACARRHGRALLSLALASLLILTPTYGHNVIDHQSPLYPMGKVNIMTNQASDSFLAENRFRKWWLATMNPPSNQSESPVGASFFVPRIWHFHKTVQQADTRIGGFGPVFPWMLVASLLALLFATRSRRVGHTGGPAIRGIGWGVFWLLACSAVNPEMWWARYVPFQWEIPILIALLALQTNAKWLAGATLSLSALFTALAVPHQLQMAGLRTMEFDTALEHAKGAGGWIVPVGTGNRGTMGAVALSEYALEQGLTVRISADAKCETQFLGIVPVCRLASR